jgi:hypothetical protein
MTETTRPRARSAASAALVLMLASLALAACGGSSKTSSSTATGAATTATSATTTTSTTAATQPAQLRACLRKAGIPVSNSVSSISEVLANQPKGVSREQLLAAAKGCGGIGTGATAGKPHVSAAAYKQAFVKFVSCMNEHGVKLPAPNTSGKGPLIDTKGIDTASASYKAAAEKCSPILRGVLSLPTVKKP